MRRRLAPTLLAFLLCGFGTDPANGQGVRIPSAPRSLDDPRLAPLKSAAAAWRKSVEGRRTVVDQVCLVPDTATFFEAIAAWDESSYFPILIEDVPNTLRFLRAFRPARVVRFPKRSVPIGEGRRWDAAITALTRATGSETEAPQAEAKPTLAKAPGIVFSHAASPSLAAAVALAGGRGQSLVTLSFDGEFDTLLDEKQVGQFQETVETLVALRTKDYEALGDACDFITLAGNWPYRYGAKDGYRCVDDLIGRSPRSLKRWAFTGRIQGDEATTVYQAMCSLFLSTDSVGLFNSYPTNGPPWAEYRMDSAAARFSSIMPTELVSGERATLDGWRRLFDPLNKHALVLVNTKGGPANFDLVGRGGSTLDVPLTVPAAVALIHSFSAASPQDDATIAGRWIANGAFVYHGSVHEPYLAAFRTPELTSSLILEGLPLGAVFRQLSEEPLGIPWKLIYLGDPLYRVTPRSRAAARSSDFGATADWPRHRETDRPATDAPAGQKFAWTLRTALSRTTKDTARRGTADLADLMATIDREEVESQARRLLDDLAGEVFFWNGRYRELRTRVSHVPPGERSPYLKRLAETSVVLDLQRFQADSFAKAIEVWEESMSLDLGIPIQRYGIEYLTAVANTPKRRAALKQALVGVQAGLMAPESVEIVRKALQGLDKR